MIARCGSGPADLETLRESERRYRELFNHLHTGVVVYEAIGDGENFVIRDFNPAAARIERTTQQAVIGKLVTEAFPGVEEFGLLEVLRRVWRTAMPEAHPSALYRDERLTSWRDNYVYRLPSGMVVAVYEDVTEHKQVEEALRERERELRTLLANVPGMAYQCANDPDYTMEALSQGVAQLTGYAADELLGDAVASYGSLIHPADAEMLWGTIRGALREHRSWTLEYRIRTAGGEEKWVWEHGTGVFDGDDAALALEGFVMDVSERKQAELELRSVKEAAEKANRELVKAQRVLELQARTDALTGVMNRRAILERLREEMARAERYGTSLGVAIIDIDRFKEVNDTYGHGAGDEVLREVVARGSQALRPYDGFGRVGAEEFLAIIPQTGESRMRRALERVRRGVCSTPVKVDQQEIAVAVSIGASLHRGGGFDDLIRSADAALNQAKALGRDRVVVGPLVS